MDYLQISKSPSLKGSISISGAKNSALPILAATLLSKNEVKISNLPDVADVKLNILCIQGQFMILCVKCVHLFLC